MSAAERERDHLLFMHCPSSCLVAVTAGRQSAVRLLSELLGFESSPMVPKPVLELHSIHASFVEELGSLCFGGVRMVFVQVDPLK